MELLVHRVEHVDRTEQWCSVFQSEPSYSGNSSGMRDTEVSPVERLMMFGVHDHNFSHQSLDGRAWCNQWEV